MMTTMDKEPLREIIRETSDLIRRQAQSRRGTLLVSPEVAARWQALSFTRAGGAPLSTEDLHQPLSRAIPDATLHAATSASGLGQLRKLVSECRLCNLCERRTQTVFADGNENADLVFVGEAPGEQEDLQGLPFVGRAGQLLTDIIVKGMQMRREDVYICNVLKCRPPENRDPLPEEKQK
ncbi:MAG: uracil-DNA glycosylase, partial [Candidatus Hydrogenedentales bacterium]